jgi:hypothetical protein
VSDMVSLVSPKRCGPPGTGSGRAFPGSYYGHVPVSDMVTEV